MSGAADPRDLRPRSGVDRRVEPRREADRLVHYAEVGVLSAAQRAGQWSSIAELADNAVIPAPLADLIRAAAAYAGAIEAAR